MFYSKSTGGFYDASIHGARTITVIKDTWVRPDADGEPDMSAIPETVEIDNPACIIPKDAIEISQEAHATLLAGQSSGQVITADANGNPILSAPPPPTAAQLWSVYQASAQAALTESDKIILRCGENAVTVPTAWATYRKDLRAIVAATSGDPTVALPTRPAYPAGT